MRRTFAALVLLGAGLGSSVAQSVDDPFLWLEDVQGERALAWVRERNAKTIAVLGARPEYKPIYARTLEILDSKEKIPTRGSKIRLPRRRRQREEQPPGAAGSESLPAVADGLSVRRSAAC